MELTQEQCISLVSEYVKQHFVAAGMCADNCVHDTGNGNPHAHVMLTMRPFSEGGKWGMKQKKEYILDENGGKIYDKATRSYQCNSIATTDWNEHTKAEEWRAAWARTQRACRPPQLSAARNRLNRHHSFRFSSFTDGETWYRHGAWQPHQRN